MVVRLELVYVNRLGGWVGGMYSSRGVGVVCGCVCDCVCVCVGSRERVGVSKEVSK